MHKHRAECLWILDLDMHHHYHFCIVCIHVCVHACMHVCVGVFINIRAGGGGHMTQSFLQLSARVSPQVWVTVGQASELIRRLPVIASL